MSASYKSLYSPDSPARGLVKLGLRETRFPLKTNVQVKAINDLWTKAKQLTWDPRRDIAYERFDRAKYSREQLDAARLGWSRRAWTEYTGIIESPAMLIRLALDGQAPIEAKFLLASKVMEEARHCEASFLLAEAMGGYIQEPPPHDAIIRLVVAGFRDRLAFNSEVSALAGIAGWHIISEGIALDIFAARYRSCDEPVTKEVLRLIMQDEVRHVRVGWDLIEALVPSLPKEEVKHIEEVVVDVMENVEMKGFHSMCLLPELDSALKEAEEIAAAARLGFCPAIEEHRVFVKSIQEIRERFSKIGIRIPVYKEVEEAVA
jgi:hypothetical protein